METHAIVGLYILHPNNIGRCGHICNASYAVWKNCRGRHIGELLVKDCMTQAKELGFKILQFNAVVATNVAALKLYARLGFVQLGVIPGGFLMKDGHYEDIIPHYHLL
jgi:L-amino acid N-acyltransferase YncA